MARNEVRLRRIESPDELAPANELAREFGDWATERIRVELEIVVPADADHPTEVLDKLLASGGRLYVAEVDGVAVGVGGLRRLSESAGEIKRMFVRPTARGLGVGRAIVERLIDDARELGFETIYLESASFIGACALPKRRVRAEWPLPGSRVRGCRSRRLDLDAARPARARNLARRSRFTSRRGSSGRVATFAGFPTRGLGTSG
jgi:GNAT superfamily N-acetyltransferase